MNNLSDTFLTSSYKLKNSTPIQVTSDFLQSKQNLTPLKFEPPVISFLPRPVLDIFSKIDFDSFSPNLYNAEIVDASESGIRDEILYQNYFITMPPSAGGGSGSPIFFKCKGVVNGKNEEWIEFAGMQCANLYKKSLLSLEQQPNAYATIILKADVIWKLFNELY